MKEIKMSRLETTCRNLTIAPGGDGLRLTLEDLKQAEKALKSRIVSAALVNALYQALSGDLLLIEEQGNETSALAIAKQEIALLEKSFDGVICDYPDMPTWSFDNINPDLLYQWMGGPETKEEAETLFFETMKACLQTTGNLSAAMIMMKCLVTQDLAVRIEELHPKLYPRTETKRCIELAQYITPFSGPKSLFYICYEEGDLFFMYESFSKSSAAIYTDAIHQLEKYIHHEELEAYLKSLLYPSMDWQLEIAIREWLGPQPQIGFVAK